MAEENQDHEQSLLRGWEQRVKMAAEKGPMEDFVTLGEEARSPGDLARVLQQCPRLHLARPGLFDKVAICSGHMIDAPDRPTPRFPAEKEAVVREKIAEQLAAWDIRAGDLAICGGAAGADILFAEECLRRGATLRLLLAQEVGDFVRDSVQPAGHEWVRRIYALSGHAEVATQPQRLGPPPKGVSLYSRTNLWMINSALTEALDAGKIFALLVWDEEPTGDGPGGTLDFSHRLRQLGGHVEVINPTKLP